MSTFNVDEADRDPVEKAIQADAFKRLARDSRGRDIISIQTPSQDYIAVVSVEHDAVMIHTTRRVESDDFESTLSFFREL